MIAFQHYSINNELKIEGAAWRLYLPATCAYIQCIAIAFGYLTLSIVKRGSLIFSVNVTESNKHFQ